MYILLRLVFIILLLQAGSVLIYSQTEMSDYSRVGASTIGTTLFDDYQCVGINPANLGLPLTSYEFLEISPIDVGYIRESRKLCFTLGEIGLAVSSSALKRSNFYDALFGFNSSVFDQQSKVNAAKDFSGNGIFFNLDMLSFAASWRDSSLGGFAVSVRERVNGNFSLDYESSQVTFLGRKFSYFDSLWVRPADGDTIGFSRNPKRFSELFDSLKIGFMWTREYSLSYGRTIYSEGNQCIAIGMSCKFIQGFGLLNAYVDQNRQVEAYSSIAPLFNINYGKATTPSQLRESGLVPVGIGFGVDIGVTAKLDNRWNLGVSIIDIGSINWKGNVYKAQDTILNGLSSLGFNSYNLFTEAQTITGDGSYFKWGGLNEVTTLLPTRLRIGVSYRYKVLQHFGVDIIVPLTRLQPTNLENVFVTAGAQFFVYPWLQLNGGIALGGTMGVAYPAGILFSLFNEHFECGLSFRDLSLLVTSNNPILGMSVALARFRL